MVRTFLETTIKTISEQFVRILVLTPLMVIRVVIMLLFRWLKMY